MERIEPTDSSVTADPRQKAILDNLGLVYYVYGRMNLNLPAGMEPEDAISYGIIGLMEAQDRYDVSKGRFATYAYLRIQGAILDGISLYLWSRKPEKRLYRAYRERGGSGMDSDIAVEDMGLSDQRYHQLITTLKNTVPISLDSLPNAELLLEDEFWPEIEQGTETKSLIRLVRSLLTPSERKIVFDRVFDQKPFYQIGEEMGLNASTVFRRYNKAIKRVREYFQKHPI